MLNNGKWNQLSGEKYDEKRLKNVIVFSGVLAIVLGLAYILDFHGMTSDGKESTVFWGWSSVFFGAISLLPAKNIKQGLSRILLSINLGFLILLQILPIFLWIGFHGYPITDPPFTGNEMAGHYLWSLPHVVLGVASGFSLYLLLKPRE